MLGTGDTEMHEATGCLFELTGVVPGAPGPGFEF